MVSTWKRATVAIFGLFEEVVRWRGSGGGGMLPWGGGGWGGVPRMRRTLLLLAFGASCAVLLLYWRQQSDEPHRRDLSRLNKYSGPDPHWTWTCRNQRCERQLAEPESTLQSLATCNMLCASTQLWPQPTGPVTLATAAQPVSPHLFSLHIIQTPSDDVERDLKGAFHLMRSDLEALEKTSGNTPPPEATPVLVRVAVNGSGDSRLRLDTDESYEISLKPTTDALVADIAARTFCGARNAFETLTQLVWMDPYASGGSLLMLETASIIDAPRFHYRGLLLDTARNFFTVKDIIRTIDAMAANKLNTFHWHVTDSQSFPLKLASTIKLADRGAYGPDEVYTTDDVKEIVHHARLRGIRVLIEIDAPAHVGRAWSWGAEDGLGDLAYCVEQEPWSNFCGEPPCGQLNPRNDNVYDILEAIYKEIIDLTGVDDVFHLGGDEVSENCWHRHFNDTEPMELWLEFTNKAMARLVKANGGKRPPLTLLWSSRLTHTPYLETLDKNMAIQVWGASGWAESIAVLESGHRSVLSHVDAWYLDCGFGSWRDSSDGHCGPYRNWQQMYEHRPWAGLDRSTAARILGGAAAQWTEQLGSEGLDARIWPRAAAFAERVWSDCQSGANSDAHLRLDTQRSRLVTRGVRAAPLWPRWCTQNPTACLVNIPP